jgi:integral membrane protein
MNDSNRDAVDVVPRAAQQARRVTNDERYFAELTQLRHLELASLVEAATLAVLVFVAVPLKHLGGWDVGVRVVGPLHGFAFVAYLWNVWQAGAGGRWRGAELARLVVCACIPLGGFLNWRWLVRRTEARVRTMAAEALAGGLPRAFDETQFVARRNVTPTVRGSPGCPRIKPELPV